MGYGVFEAHSLLSGPELSISTPRRGDTFVGPLLEIHGEVANATNVRINGKPIVTDLSGAFSEKLLTPRGYGVVLVEAENRFGRSATERIELIGRPSP